MRFVDTNVLLYAISPDPEEGEKRRQARALLREHDLALSIQVLQEFYAQATRLSRPSSLRHDEAVAFIQMFQVLPVQPITLEVFLTALEICQRFPAFLLGQRHSRGRPHQAVATPWLSEDLSPDQDYGGLRVVNPFSPSLSEILARAPGKAVKAEEGDVVGGLAAGGQVRHDLADNAGELEAVA